VLFLVYRQDLQDSLDFLLYSAESRFLPREVYEMKRAARFTGGVFSLPFPPASPERLAMAGRREVRKIKHNPVNPVKKNS